MLERMAVILRMSTGFAKPPLAEALVDTAIIVLM